MEMPTIYFAKVNLISEHIYSVYNDKGLLRKIMLDVLTNFKDGVSYTEEYSFIDESGKQYTNEIEYSIYVREKTDTYIRGRVDKTSKLFYKDRNPLTNELESKAIPNVDANEFYFDVFSEIIGYNTSNRFGHKKFLKVFGELINKSMECAEKEYRFVVDRYTNGIDIEYLHQELKRVEGIQRLSILLKPVNPDSEILKSIFDNGKDRLEEFEEANITTKSILLTSTSRVGLNIDSKLVQESLNEVDNLQRNVSAKEATKNGYAKVEVTGRDGITRSTEDALPVRKHIRKMTEFVIACQEVIAKSKHIYIDDGE